MKSKIYFSSISRDDSQDYIAKNTHSNIVGSLSCTVRIRIIYVIQAFNYFLKRNIFQKCFFSSSCVLLDAVKVFCSRSSCS